MKPKKSWYDNVLDAFQRAVNDARDPSFELVYGVVKYDIGMIDFPEEDIDQRLDRPLQQTMTYYHQTMSGTLSEDEMVAWNEKEKLLYKYINKSVVGVWDAGIVTSTQIIARYMEASYDRLTHTSRFVIFAYSWDGTAVLPPCNMWIERVDNVTASLLTTNTFKL